MVMKHKIVNPPSNSSGIPHVNLVNETITSNHVPLSPIANNHRPLTPEVIGWIGLSVALVISLLVSYSIILWLRNRNRKTSMVSFICGLGLMFAIMLTFIMPIDVFVVSYMKDKTGHFKHWVKQDIVMHIQKVISIAYFTLYGLLAAFVFGILPFFYFLYDGVDYNDEVVSKKCTRSLYATIITMLLLLAVCLCGAFIPTNFSNSTIDTTDTSLIGKVNPRVISTIGFVYSIMVIAGIITACFYTAYGLSHTPMVLLRCSSLFGQETLDSPVIDTQARSNIVTLNTANLKSEFARSAVEAHQTEHAGLINEQPMTNRESPGFMKKIAKVLILYPFKLIFGLSGLFISSLLIVSLSTVCVDKWMHSSYSTGYTLDKSSIVNPADIIITKSQQYFPLDYTIFAMMFATLLVASLYSIKSLGIRILLVKMYNVRSGRSNAQALICFTFMMLVICFSFSSLLFNILPTYMTYGHQTYINKTNNLTVCDGTGPRDECVETILAKFLKVFFLKATFFASIIFYAINMFLVCFVLGIFVSVYRVCLMEQRDDRLDALIHDSNPLLDDELDDDDVLIA